MTRRLRVLAAHPFLGAAGLVRDEFEGAQAYVDIGAAEWVDPPRAERAVPIEAAVETTPEAAVARPSARSRTRAARAQQ